ncbi:MAG: 50S ribosomal protein L23 [Candidatus Saccharimonadales bacterium]
MFVKPRLSEKSFALSQSNNTYVVDVPAELNSAEIAAQVSKQFDVTVKNVRVVNRKGKVKRVMNTTGKRSSNRQGTQRDVKKAYITLATGSHLPFFVAEEKEIAEAKKVDSKASKTKATESKKASEGKTSVVKKLTGRGKKESKS